MAARGPGRRGAGRSGRDAARAAAPRAVATKGRLPVIPVIAVVGEKKSGKTSLIEKLIPELKRWGYLVGVVKRCHCRFDFDREGKDTWRYDAAGADGIAVTSPGRMAVVRKTQAADSVEKLLRRHLEGLDVVLVEGGRGEAWPKVEVFRDGVSERLSCREDELLAVVSDVPLKTRAPCLPPDGARELGRLVAAHLSQIRAAHEEYLWP